MLLKDFVDKIYCINLKSRQDKRKWMFQHLKKHNMKAKFFPAVENKIEPAKGCYKSHMKVIQDAKKQGYERVLILEDDCLFIPDKLTIDENKIPKDWEMLFLGANLQTLYGDSTDYSIKNKTWVKMGCYAAHCYIIGKHSYDLILEQLVKEYVHPVDVIYDLYIHSRKKSYALVNQIATQKDGYSNIEKKQVKYVMQNVDSLLDIKHSDMDYNEEEKTCVLKLKGDYTDDDLPFISILTPTKNRKKLFPLAIHSFQNFVYPKEKLEWVIVDDSDNGEWLTDILPVDKRIKYVKINTTSKIPIGYKRNLCVKYATHDYLVHMDDDDYYVPTSILTRAKIMLDNPHIDMVGCGIVSCFDVIQKKFYNVGTNRSIAEAAMMYKRSFFEERRFQVRIRQGEGLLFLKDRKHKALMIPHTYIMFVLNHRNNMTGNIRMTTDESCFLNDIYQLPKDVMDIIEKIHR